VPRRLLILLTILAATTPASSAVAAEPPNQHDPCSRGGRDSCATTGVGEYRTYRVPRAEERASRRRRDRRERRRQDAQLPRDVDRACPQGAALPASIYSRTGPRRLVLVTCGGPFNQNIGHYRDNIVVTAVPA
jgi:hypothetical protein